MGRDTLLVSDWAFCDAMLPRVSRSFALIIPMCPPPLNKAMCVAYLICRIADTIEDEPDLEPVIRADLYDRLLYALEAPGDAGRAESFVSAWPEPPEDDYGDLIEGTESVVAAYASLPAELSAAIADCVREMVGGMRSVCPAESKGGIEFFCRDLDELDAYCHFVAGTVGVMSTRLFEARLGPVGFHADAAWRERGRRMGLGLQLTNIIKDAAVDARRGVCYLPRTHMAWTDAGLRLSHDRGPEVFERAIGHLDAAIAYILAVPGGETGIRTFLLGSVLPAIATLEVAAGGTMAHPRIGREKMAEILACIERHVADDGELRRFYDQHRQRTLAML